MSDAKSKVRNSVLGADKAFRVIEGGPPNTPTEPPQPTDDDPCPVTALGDNNGTYHFLDPIGQKREFTARELGNRHALIGLFRGDDAWLRRHFKVEKEFENPDGTKVKRIIDFRVNDATRHLIALASKRGLFGARITMRRPGIWRSDDGMPIVHCGDAVLIDDTWHPAGMRTGNQIWAAAEATPRPGIPCDRNIGATLQQDLQRYWSFRNPGGAVAIMGLLATGYLSAALDWRPNGFVTGGTGSGKTALRRVVRAAWPLHNYSNDTSKAGMEQTVAGLAIPAVIDEANDRNKSSGRDLIDLVLSASGDEGTKLARGTSDGKGRSAEVVSSVIMFSINPPELEPQHLNRFVMIDLCKPDEGADFKLEHRKIAADMARHATALWGRAIASFERYNECLRTFRLALRDRKCDPREMDGKGALLAGWWILTHEGLPSDKELLEGVGALGDFIVTAARAAADDGPRRMLNHLLSYMATLHRSSDREPIGVLLDRAYGAERADPYDEQRNSPQAAVNVLRNYGVRPIRACAAPPDRRLSPCKCLQCWDSQRNSPVPRIDLGDGVWIANRNPELTKIFDGTEFDGGRWRHELLRLDTATPSGRSIRIGGSSGHATWLSRSALQVEEDDPDAM
ncbi:MAG: hypothetical protein P4M09_22590 [Devosia sp.]|nr:hypothetical protein [Devosia sp.]